MVDKKDYSIVANMSYVLKKILAIDPKLVLVIVLGSISKAVFHYIWIAVPKLVIDYIQNQESVILLFQTFIVILLIQLCFGGFITYSNYLLNWKSLYISKKFLLDLVHKQNAVLYEYLEQPVILDQLRRAKAGARKSEDMIADICSTITGLSKIIFSIGILYTLDVRAILIILFLSFMYYFVLNKTIQYDKRKSWDRLAPMWRKLSYMKDVGKNAAYAKDIKLYHAKNFLLKKQKEVNDEAHGYLAASKKRWAIFGFYYNLLTALQEILLYLMLVYLILRKGMSIGNFTLYAATIRIFSATLNEILYNIASIKRQSLYITDYRVFMECTEFEKKQEKKRNINEIKNYNFTFENVSFCYPGQKKEVIKSLNLQIDNKSKVAIVGLNGAGKSTFIKLLLRLYEPSEGRIYIDGYDIRDFDINDYYSLFSPVFQNIILFAYPLAENISMSVPKKTNPGLVYEMIDMAGLKEKVNVLKHGINSQVTKYLYEDGVDFSGGEKQKLAIARALYKKTNVLILDEPTSALDAIAEYNLYMKFNEMAHNKTSIFISHRLTTTRFCDIILVFTDGQVVAQGTHHQLIEKNEFYRTLYHTQAKYYL